MSDKGIRVTAVDLETGESAEKTIESGNYVIIVASPCHVAHEAHHANGTTVLTIKGRAAELMASAWVEPSVVAS